MAKACAISSKVRQEVLERDDHRCIICGEYRVQIAHYISRARAGLGIPQNLGCLCVRCHTEYDNGKYHKEIKNAFKDYLKAHYPDWDESKLTYSKWSDINGNSL